MAAAAGQNKQHSGSVPSSQMLLRLVVFTCRDPRTDFRLSLVDALRRRGHEVHYIWLKRRPSVSGPFDDDSTVLMSLASCFRYLRRVTNVPGRTTVYFTSTNLCYPALILALRLWCGRGVWCFDMHDDLLYALHGAARLRARIRQAALLRAFDLMVHAAPTLKELFPASHHLGNASSLGPLPREALRFDRVLILASIDERMDFAFLAAVAARCPGISFDVYGQVSRTVEAAMRALQDAGPNIHYYGPYVTADLIPILQRYAVMLAPYLIADRLTRYIDPLRYYHALNTGMEIITTAIPQAGEFADRLFLVRAADDVAQALERLQADNRARRNPGTVPPITWDLRAAQLVDIILAAPRTAALVRKA